MARQVPAQLRSGQSLSLPDRPDVVVLESRPDRSGAPSAVGRALVSLTPDLIRVVERSLANRKDARHVAPVTPQDARAYRSGIQLSEVEYDTRLPFLRKVTVRKANAWTSDLPFDLPPVEPASRRGGRFWTAGILSVGGAFALAALGLIANRAGSIPGLGSRRGY